MYMEMLLSQAWECHQPLRAQGRTGQGRAGWVGRAGGKQRGKLFLPGKAASDFRNHEKGYLGFSRLKQLHLLALVAQMDTQEPRVSQHPLPILGQLGVCQSQPAQGGFALLCWRGLRCSSSPTALPAVSGHMTCNPAL